MENKLSGSLMSYLMVIYDELHDSSKGVQPNIIATKMDVTRAAVTKAMDRLASRGFITKIHYGDIFLTDLGREEIENLIARYKVVNEFLLKMGVSNDDAASQAKKLVPVLDDVVFIKLEESLKNSK